MRTPFMPIPLLFLSPPDSEFLAFLQEANQVVEREPAILARIEADLDQHGKDKKALRIQDAKWEAAKTLGLPLVGQTSEAVEASKLKLGVGRPRTPAYVVYMFLVGRGYYGGFKSSEADTLLLESTTMTVFLANQGMTMPGASTFCELVNAVSNETRSLILDAQMREVLDEGWDDLKTLLVDSTAVKGNTEWPKDSHLMVALVARVLHRGRKLGRFGLTPIDEQEVVEVLGEMTSLDKQISLEAGKPGSARGRKKLYKKLLRLGRRALALLDPHVQRAEETVKRLDILPSRLQMVTKLVQALRSDLQNLAQVIQSCTARVIHERKVPVAEKILSVSDPDAGFIAKGGRQPVVGYKPQLGRSGAGFVLGLIVPQGNAADSTQLVPMFNQVVARTGVVPTVISTDDGYADRKSRNLLLGAGPKIVSISGSKGKKITTEKDWNDPDYVGARNGRSAVESLMFTIKHGFDFGRVARRGLENVRAEMLEKVLAYNFCRMATSRRAAAEADQCLTAAADLPEAA